MQTGLGDIEVDRSWGTSSGTEKAWWPLPELCGGVWVAQTFPPNPLVLTFP